MLADTLTISVDEENDGVGPVNHVFTRFEDTPTRSTYIGANHSLSARDTLNFYRTLPKPSGNFNGVAKTALKFSKDIVVDGRDGADVTAPIIIEVSASIPVGATAAQVLVARQRVVSLLDLDAVMVPFMGQQMI